MRRTYFQMLVLIVTLMSSSIMPVQGQQPPTFEKPIAIDGLAESLTFILGAGGTIYRTYPKNGGVGFSVLTHINSNYIPIDLSISSGQNQLLLGARTVLIVLGNSESQVVRQAV